MGTQTKPEMNLEQMAKFSRLLNKRIGDMSIRDSLDPIKVREIHEQCRNESFHVEQSYAASGIAFPPIPFADDEAAQKDAGKRITRKLQAAIKRIPKVKTAKLKKKKPRTAKQKRQLVMMRNKLHKKMGWGKFAKKRKAK